MSTLPSNRLESVQFCENHTPVWGPNAPQIGLLPAQVSALAALTMTARQAYIDAEAARQASRAATQTFYNTVREMRLSAADLIRLIKTFAELNNDPEVYAIAQIPPPAAPTPATAPGEPTSIAVTLNPGGSLTLSWESLNSAASTGGFFNVSRKLAGQSSFTPIGGTPGSTTQMRRPSFTDGTLPIGTDSAVYIITPRRGALIGKAGEALTVQFGVGGGPGVMVTGGTLALAA